MRLWRALQPPLAERFVGRVQGALDLEQQPVTAARAVDEYLQWHGARTQGLIVQIAGDVQLKGCIGPCLAHARARQLNRGGELARQPQRRAPGAVLEVGSEAQLHAEVGRRLADGGARRLGA